MTLQDSSSRDVIVSAAGPAAGHHPAWLRAFWHYDLDYAYALETYEYGPYSTTDPCYIEDGVRLSPNAYHDEFLTAAKANLLRFLKLTGQNLPVTREVPVRDLPDLPLARQSRRRLEPDLGVWPEGTQVRREFMLQWEEVGLPRLVVECLSQSTMRNDLVTKPDLYRDLGVEEYWICRAHPMQAHTVYQRDGRRRWQECPVPGEQGLYSPVLGIGCAPTRQTASSARTRRPGGGSRPMPASMTKGDTGDGDSPSSTSPKFCARHKSWRLLGRNWRLQTRRLGRASRTCMGGIAPKARDHVDRWPGWIDHLGRDCVSWCTGRRICRWFLRVL